MNASLINDEIVTDAYSPTLAPPLSGDTNTSGVSWGAILAGAAGAAALSLILLILGFGLGLSSVSPWSGSGVSAGTLGVSAIVWIAFTQLAASGLGGYLAGRLRVKWARLHGDEVYFRDTAHGFLAWAIASLVTAIFLSSAVAGAVGGTVRTGAAVAQGAASTAATATATLTRNSTANSDSLGYYVDGLFRTAPDASQPLAAPDPAAHVEAARIFANDIRTGSMSPEDKRYVGQLVAHQTGLSQADAEKRVGDIYARVTTSIDATETAARQAADKARKAASHSALWMFITLLAGAFFASLMALFGGRLRDEVDVV